MPSLSSLSTSEIDQLAQEYAEQITSTEPTKTC